MNDKRVTRPVVENPDSVTHWTCPDAPNEGSTYFTSTHFMERNLGTGAIRCRYCKRSETALRNEQTAILVNEASHWPEVTDSLSRKLRRMSRMQSLLNPNIQMQEMYRGTLREAAAVVAAAEVGASRKPQVADSTLEQIIRDFWDEEIETLPESEQDEVALASHIRAAGYSRPVSETVPSELIEAVLAARKAADGDSNDTEIQLLQDALNWALEALGLDIPDPEDDDTEEEKK